MWTIVLYWLRPMDRRVLGVRGTRVLLFIDAKGR